MAIVDKITGAKCLSPHTLVDGDGGYYICQTCGRTYSPADACLAIDAGESRIALDQGASQSSWAYAMAASGFARATAPPAVYTASPLAPAARADEAERSQRSKMIADKNEIKALKLFVSPDRARASLCHIWCYEDCYGITYVATDGHTLTVRTAGRHITRPVHEIALLPVRALDEETCAEPPPWHSILGEYEAVRAESVMAIVRKEQRAPCTRHGIDPALIARVAKVETAAKKRSRWRVDYRSIWTIPADALDPWAWTLDTPWAFWQGIVMPRRI